MGHRLRTALLPYFVAALALAAAVVLRPWMVPWLGDTTAFIVLCAVVAFAAIGAMAWRSGRTTAVAPKAGLRIDAKGVVPAAAERFLAAIVETSDDAIVSKTLDGIIRSWNAGAQRVFGYAAEEAVGRHIALIVPPERLAEEDQILRRLRAGERIDHFETERIRSDGRRIPISLTISPIRDDTGRIIGASKIARDITARKEAEAQLREKEERLRLATQTGKVGIWEWDGATDRMAWTDSLYAAHGLAPMDFEGTFAGFTARIHPDDRDRVTSTLRRCLKERTTCELEYRAVKPDGRVTWMYTTTVTVQGENGARRVLGASLDITDRHQAEEALRLADRRKDRFLATLAHELRNPLAPIWTAAQVLKLKAASDPDMQWSSEVIERQMRQMVRLLEDLLDVSRISQNKLDLRKEPLELSAVIRAAVETSRPMIDSGHHELSVLLPQQPVQLYGDPVRLAQVFSNLLNNAAKYMPPGGRIVVRARQHADRVAVSVRDQGVGIAADKIAHLFELFSQVSQGQQHAPGGLGIGLSLARALVDLHGGSIEARSDGLGKGSEFVVTLPTLGEKAHTLASGPDGEGERGTDVKRRLLVVDDLRDSADSLAALMRIKGHEVHTAYEGETAVALAAKLQPDVMLLDIGLPKLNGYEVCRRVREAPGGDSMFIVALTGWGQPSDRRLTEEAGFDWHLVKPVDSATLADLLVTLPTMTRSLRATEAPR